MIYIFAFIISIIIARLYAEKKYALFLFTLLMSALSVFEPNLDWIGLDYILIRGIGQNAVFFSVIWLLVYKRIKIKGKSSSMTLIEKMIVLIFLYSLIVAFYTLITGKESLFNVIALMKPYTILLSIFLIKEIDSDDCKKSLSMLFKVTAVVGVIAFIQVVVGFNLFGQTVIGYDEGVDRFWSPYSMASFCLFLSLLFPRKYGTFSFFYFLLLVFLPLRRGLIISTIITLGLYYMYCFRHGGVPKSFWALVFACMLSMPLLINRFSSEKDNASSDFSNVVSGQVDYQNFRSGIDGGTFMFRIAVFLERLDYMLNRPSELLTGVGLIHEDSAQKEFNFFLGSRKTVNEEITVQQIDTTDIAWPPILMRLGLIGVVLYLIFFITLQIYFIRNVKISIWAMVGCCFLFNFLFFSFADAQLVQFQAIILYFILFRLVDIDKQCKIQLNTNKQ